MRGFQYNLRKKKHDLIYAVYVILLAPVIQKQHSERMKERPFKDVRYQGCLWLCLKAKRAHFVGQKDVEI